MMIFLCACGQKNDVQTANVTGNLTENESTDIKETVSDSIPLNIRQEVIDIPEIETEHNIFFFSDSHISMCDYRDIELVDKASQRAESFSAFVFGYYPAGGKHRSVLHPLQLMVYRHRIDLMQ